MELFNHPGTLIFGLGIPMGLKNFAEFPEMNFFLSRISNRKVNKSRNLKGF